MGGEYTGQGYYELDIDEYNKELDSYLDGEGMNAVKQKVPSWIKHDPETRIKEAKKRRERNATIIEEARRIEVAKARKADEDEGLNVVIEDLDRAQADLDSDDEDEENDKEGYIFY